MSRLLSVTWGLGVVLAVASPLLRSARDDSYPLSTFPMFATPVQQKAFYSAEGVQRDGSRVMLPPELIANGADMQSARTLRDAHSQGKQMLRQLCDRIASKVPEHAKLRQVQRVEIVSTEYDPVAYFVSGPAPLAREALHKCKVRSAP